jgi:hypothetical protein
MIATIRACSVDSMKMLPSAFEPANGLVKPKTIPSGRTTPWYAKFDLYVAAQHASCTLLSRRSEMEYLEPFRHQTSFGNGLPCDSVRCAYSARCCGANRCGPRKELRTNAR